MGYYIPTSTSQNPCTALDEPRALDWYRLEDSCRDVSYVSRCLAHKERLAMIAANEVSNPISHGLQVPLKGLKLRVKLQFNHRKSGVHYASYLNDRI